MVETRRVGGRCLKLADEITAKLGPIAKRPRQTSGDAFTRNVNISNFALQQLLFSMLDDYSAILALIAYR